MAGFGNSPYGSSVYGIGGGSTPPPGPTVNCFSIDCFTTRVYYLSEPSYEDAINPANYTIAGTNLPSVQVVGVEYVTDFVYDVKSTRLNISSAYTLTVSS